MKWPYKWEKWEKVRWENNNTPNVIRSYVTICTRAVLLYVRTTIQMQMTAVLMWEWLLCGVHNCFGMGICQCLMVIWFDSWSARWKLWTRREFLICISNFRETGGCSSSNIWDTMVASLGRHLKVKSLTIFSNNTFLHLLSHADCRRWIFYQILSRLDLGLFFSAWSGGIIFLTIHTNQLGVLFCRWKNRRSHWNKRAVRQDHQP